MRADSFRCVDVEGGTVDRLRDALAPIPLRKPWRAVVCQLRTKISASDRQHGELIAQAVKAFGFNTTLAPVLDLALPASAEVMGTARRCADAAGVVDMRAPFWLALPRTAWQAAASIFRTGRRHARLASRDPVDSPRTREMWQPGSLVPSHRCRTTFHLVMVNHAAYPDHAG